MASTQVPLHPIQEDHRAEIHESNIIEGKRPLFSVKRYDPNEDETYNSVYHEKYSWYLDRSSGLYKRK